LTLPVEGELKPQRESRATSADRARNEAAPAPQARLDQPALQGGIKSAQPFPAEAPATAAPPAAPASIESSVPGAAARQESERALRDADAVARAPQAGPAQALAKRGELAEAAKSTAETPEQELERIARLRAAARNDEADKALAEFRKRHPEYRIPEAMLQRLERR
jgi:hypothetical protein